MKAVLVTGATGLVGSYVVERFLVDGWRVRALVRDEGSAAWLGARGVELRRGDILAPDTFMSAAAGCDVIVHAAAAVVTGGGWEAYRRPNIDGTQHAIAAAERSGARLVQVSSVAVYGPDARYAGDGPCTEDGALLPLPRHAHYARSKRESEAMVLDAHAAGRIHATAVRPPVIYGVRDRQFVPRIARALRMRVVPLIAGGRSTLAIVHGANVADGIARAAVRDEAGGRAYNLANDHDVSVAEFMRLAAAGLGTRVVAVPFPLPLARAMMALLRVGATLALGRNAGVMAGSTLSFLTTDNPFSSARARRELGWAPPVHPADAIPEAFRWYAETTAT